MPLTIQPKPILLRTRRQSSVMRKLSKTSARATDEEVVELKKFCEENRCTQYSALTAALRELLSKPIEKTEESIEPEAIEVLENKKQKE